MAEHRGGTKGRRMGSSRRRQLREGSSEAPTAAPGKEPPWASEMVQKVQDFFRERDKDQTGFVTRSDMKKLQQEDFPCSTEELELIFDGLDAAGTGRLRTEEFTAGLCQFLSSQQAARDHRRRKTASRRLRLVLPSPVEVADSKEQRHFAAFMEQLGTDNISEEKEIWQLWVKLRQDEPQLLGNLEDFLAKMRHRIQEARSKKEALEVTLNKCVAEHDKEVQQLCEALEQQIQQEKQWLEQKSMARSHQHGVELQQALDASEREVQRLVTVQMELETRCRSLRSTQQATSTENRQLEESNRELEDHLQHLHQQLQQTQGHLQTARAAVAWEHVEELRDRAVAELPEETPVSPQMSLAKSEKYRSKMRIRLGSQGSEPKAKSTHQVVWEMPLAARSHLGAVRRTSSTEDDPFPEFLKEERFSDQSSLLREMNDAIAALSKPLKPQAPGAPLVPADAAPHPRDDAETQTGLEAATAFAPSPGVLQEVLLGHVPHELFEGDLKEGPATAHLGAPDTTQAGASVGARPHRAQKLGGEQGESPKEAWRMLIPQGEGAGVKKLMLKAAKHPQGAPAESVEAGKLMEMKGVGWRQETTGWEKARLPGDIEEVALSKGENSEAGLGPLEAGLAAGWHLVTGELGPAAAREECAKPQSTGLGEEADPPSGRSEKLAVKPGEHLEPEPPTWGWERMGAAQGDGALPEVTVDPGPRMLEEEHISAKSLDAIVPAAQHGGSSRAGAEEGEVEVTQPMEAEPQGEFAMGDAARGGTAGTEVLPVPPTDGQEGGKGTEVQLREAQSCDVSVRLPADVGAAPQPRGEPGSPGTEQGGSSGAPRVEPLEEDDKPELGPGEGPSPAETSAGGADMGGLLPVDAQALELVGTEESWAHVQLHEDPSPEAPLGGGDHAALQLGDEGEDGGRRQSERELPSEPLVDLCGAGFRQGDRAGAEEQPRTEADECSAGMGDAAPLPLVSFRGQKPGLEEDGDVHYPEEEQELELVQGEGANKDGLCLVKSQSLELEEAEDSRVDAQLLGDLSPETPRGEESGAAMQLAEEAEGGGQGQGECELLHELDPRGEGAGAHVQPQEEAVILESVEDQSTDANTQLLAEAVELKLTPGGSTEEDLQPSSEAGYLGREQRVSTAADVKLQGQMDKPELVELIEAEDFHTGTQLCGGQNPETLQEWGGCAAVHVVEEAEDGGSGQDKRGLPQEHVLHPHGLTIREGEGTPEDVQPWEVVTLESLEDQNTDANTQLLAEVLELKLTPGGSTEEDLQPLSEAGYLGREQGVGMTADVQPLEWVDKPKLVELVQAEDLHVGTQQGDGAGAGVQPWEEAVLLDTLEDQSSDANMQPLTEVEELKSTSGGRAEADLPILAAAGMQKWEQSQTPSSEAGLCAAHTADALEGAAGAPVSSPGEAASYPACAAAPEGPGLDTKLGALPDPDGQILGDTGTLELQQGEGAAAERRPLDEAQGLKVGQGERMEAGVRSFLETRGLGLKQDHGHTASALGPPVSEVALQISMLKLETMMQEDVLVPDVWRLGSSGQAAQNELQEQVSAQADKVRLGIASQWPEEKPPCVMETEQVAVRPAEPPKQEVPPASTLHTAVQQEEDAGNDQLGMVLADSSLGDAANSSMQPLRQLLGGESKDLSVGQQKKREAGQQTSQEDKPSPGAATTDGAGAAPGGSPEAFLEPDHLYNVLFVGDSHVGKTSFLYRLHADTFNPHLTATVGLDYQVKNLIVDNKRFALRLWDSAGQERYHSITRQFFRKADGVVLMYDITSEYSFSDVRYWLSCIQEGAEDGVAVLLLGNKTDCAAERRVPTKEGERLAKEHQLLFYECSAASGHNVSESMVSLIRMLKVHEDELKKKAEEVPKPSQKKKGCCW